MFDHPSTIAWCVGGGNRARRVGAWLLVDRGSGEVREGTNERERL
jgi:hypothetical protein